MNPDEFGEITVRCMDMPTCFKACCYHDDDGNEFIIVNARHTREQNALSYDHEIDHIQRGDMYDQNYREYN